ncbi:MAG: hypothetical protein AAFR98_01910 [Pseudomonadota bacterium]
MPILADQSAHGLLPTRAYRYCEAARIASSLGWYVFPPVSYSILYDGAAVFWKMDDDAEWSRLEEATLEADLDQFDANCPKELVGHCPPMVGAAEGGMLQIATGLAVTTPPDWGVLIRKPPNIPQKNHLEYFEGFVQTGKWFGPLFINLKPMKTDVEIRFEADWPVAFVQPIPISVTQPSVFQNVSFVSEFSEFSDEDWQSFGDTVLHRLGPDREVAKYAKAVRKKSS